MTSGAQAQTVGPLAHITTRSIFNGCKADNVGGQPGTVNPNSEVEPNLAINPLNPTNLLVGVQQDRWSDGGSRGLRGQYSKDGGASWHPSSTPGVTRCQGGIWPRASDPWVTFSPNGNAYFSSLVLVELANPNLFGRNGMTVSRSLDGGATWGPPTTLIDTPFAPAPNPQILNDKNSITADWHSSKYVYNVWDQLSSFTPGYGVADDSGGDNGDCGHPNCSGGKLGGAPDGMTIARRLRDHPIAPNADSATAATYPTFVTGPTILSRTTDGGSTWSAPAVIYDPGSNYQTIGNQVVILPHSIADFFTQQNDLTGADQIGYVASTDNGATWSAPVLPEVLVSGPATTPNQQQPIRSADILYSVAVHKPTGVTFLTWEDRRFSGVNEVAVAFSQDGFQWVGPVQVNQTPRNPGNPQFQQALVPTVSVADDGTAVVTYYDFRNDPVGASNDLTDYWAVFCNPFLVDCSVSSNWATEVRLTDTSFDYDMAPVARGVFLGDYEGLKSNGQTVWSVFAQEVAPAQTDLFAREITIPTTGMVSTRLVGTTLSSK